MNNEPVAWMSELGTCYHIDDIAEMDKNNANNFTIPLYTHPAKTLTDEEIHNLFLSFCNVGFMQVDEIGFARAILTKAQEK